MKDLEVLPKETKVIEPRIVTEIYPTFRGKKGQTARDGSPVPTWPELA